MRKQAFNPTDKQRRLIRRMLADPTLDVYAAAAAVSPVVTDTELIRWLRHPEFAALIDDAQAVQQRVLRQRAMVRKITGPQRQPGEAGRATQADQAGVGNSRPGDAKRFCETAKPDAETSPTTNGSDAAHAPDGPPHAGGGGSLTQEQYDEIYQRVSEGAG